MAERRTVDVVVIGDGPAGSALARQCRTRDIDVVLIGADEPWSATYGTWIDDLEVDGTGAAVGLGAGAGAGALDGPIETLLAATSATIFVHARRAHELSRPYGVFDNEALRNCVRSDVEHIEGRVESVDHQRVDGRHRLVLADGSGLTARVVVDATGWPPHFAGGPSTSKAAAWQTAFGVILRDPPAGDLGRATLMDFRAVAPLDAARSAAPAATTFCYSVPVADGWLVEETVLAAARPVEPSALLARLAARLGRTSDALLSEAVRTERVQIPMGVERPDRRSPIIAFGAAAGYVHPTTGFSVAASLRAAPRVAAAIERELTTSRDRPIDVDAIGEAVWPRAARRSRVLHDYGLDVLLRLDTDDVRRFFDVFFELPTSRWASYLRLDASPRDLALVMAQMFRSADWPLRRRLLAANPATFARLLRR